MFLKVITKMHPVYHNYLFMEPIDIYDWNAF